MNFRPEVRRVHTSLERSRMGTSNETIRDKLRFCLEQSHRLERRVVSRRTARTRGLTIDESTLATSAYREEPPTKRQVPIPYSRRFIVSSPPRGVVRLRVPLQ